MKEFPALMTRLFVRELDLRGNPEIDSIDKVPDLILHVLGLKLIRLTEDGEDKEYDCDKIWKERQLRKRIDDEEASSSQKDEGRNYDEIWKIKQMRKEIDDEVFGYYET